MGRLGSQMISTFEELRTGAEELSRILVAAGNTVSAGGMQNPLASSGVMGSALLVGKQPGGMDISYVLPNAPGASSMHGASHATADGCGGASGLGTVAVGGSGASCSSSMAAQERGGDSAAVEGLRASLAQLSVENSRLQRESAALRQRASELSVLFSKAQRRAADQQRLSRKVLSALREAHAVPRPELPPDAAKEIADLRRQLEASHTARHQQAELVRKYEQRWAALKASAKRKQAQQAASGAK